MGEQKLEQLGFIIIITLLLFIVYYSPGVKSAMGLKINKHVPLAIQERQTCKTTDRDAHRF